MENIKLNEIEGFVTNENNMYIWSETYLEIIEFGVSLKSIANGAVAVHTDDLENVETIEEFLKEYYEGVIFINGTAREKAKQVFYTREEIKNFLKENLK